ncbi:MAG: TIGR04086 family membrane protein [Bacillota bacterium]
MMRFIERAAIMSGWRVSALIWGVALLPGALIILITDAQTLDLSGFYNLIGWISVLGGGAAAGVYSRRRSWMQGIWFGLTYGCLTLLLVGLFAPQSFTVEAAVSKLATAALLGCAGSASWLGMRSGRGKGVDNGRKLRAQ